MSYRVTVCIHPKWVAHFRDRGMKLCTAFGVVTNGNKAEYNIIATSEEPTTLNTVAWTDHYAIAACKSGHDNAAYVFPNTIPVPIPLAHSFNLRQDWSINTPDPSPQAPNDGFTFVNKVSASALLFKQVRNRLRPVFLSSVGDSVPPPGQQTLRPSGTTLIFFSFSDEQTVFSSNDVRTNFYVVSYASNPKAAVMYDQEGVFSYLDDSEMVDGLYPLLMSPSAVRESTAGPLMVTEEL